MNKEDAENWQRVKDYFEELPEFKRDNMFYKRACMIVAGHPDPLDNHGQLDQEDSD